MNSSSFSEFTYSLGSVDNVLYILENPPMSYSIYCQASLLLFIIYSFIYLFFRPHYFCALHIVMDCSLTVEFLSDHFLMETVKFWRPGILCYSGFVSLAGCILKQVI